MAETILPADVLSQCAALGRSMRYHYGDSLDPLRPAHSTGLQRSDRAHALNLVMEAVRLITSAMGAAVALSDSSGLRCCASAGDAPITGSPVPLEGTLTGQCFRTGQVVTADETRKIDAFTLPTFTILLLPIRQQGTTIGILGLFWRESRALSKSTLAIAQAAASIVSIALEPEEGVTLAAHAPAALPAAYVPEAPAYVPEAPAYVPELPKTVGATKAFRNPAVTSSKQLYGLPCANCGAYFLTEETCCPVCNTPKA